MRRAAQPEPERSSYVVPVSLAPATWTHATEPVRPLVALGFALVLTTVAIDHLLSGRLTFFFDLCFVAICLLLAIRAADDAFYTAALLPPALMFLTCVLWRTSLPPWSPTPTTQRCRRSSAGSPTTPPRWWSAMRCASRRC